MELRLFSLQIFSSFHRKATFMKSCCLKKKIGLIIVYVPREKSDLRKSQIDRTLRQTDDI